MGKHAKISRTLDMYVRLCEGKSISKAEEAARFGVDERSIQRDIDDIRAFLDEYTMGNSTEQRSIVYDRAKKGFVLVGEERALMTNGEILAVSKILLESRAFKKREINSILDKLIAGCVPQKNCKIVSDLIANEKYHYVERHNKSCIKDKLWELGNEIKQCELLEITYDKQLPQNETVKRVVEPVAILFSEYYFYLNAYIVEKVGETYEQVYDYPTIFRIDRIRKYKEIGKKFKIAYANRFEEGEFRKRVQFMYAGKLLKLQFKYTGMSIEAILDRLPTAEIIQQNDEEYMIEAEVYGKGILMWLLSQGSAIEVLKPLSVREEMKKILSDMLSNYQ
ncbi:MAG: WYL domain-containing protein [Eubacteriales bacterium]|nr:WYL domain-containing protein [Eubacteriales bacterium]